MLITWVSTGGTHHDDDDHTQASVCWAVYKDMACQVRPYRVLLIVSDSVHQCKYGMLLIMQCCLCMIQPELYMIVSFVFS